MTDELSRPFTAEELDKEIPDGEETFRIIYRSVLVAGNPSEVERLYKAAASTASVLAELRYQRERMQ